VGARWARRSGRSNGVRSSARRRSNWTPKPNYFASSQGLCEKNGVELNLHNHTYEVENDLHDLKGTLARFPDAKLGPDLNWLVRGGVDPVQFLRQYGRQVVLLHLCDQLRDGRWSEALGEGDMDYGAIAAELREINFQGDAIIELAWGPRSNLRLALNSRSSEIPTALSRSTGTLQSSAQVTGGWAPAASQTKPLTIPAFGTQFFRVVN
jgi:sugar phosphate isomerase/epimerase